MPQKPIKLKDEIDLHPVLKAGLTERESTPKAPPQPKPRRKKPPTAKKPTLFDSLSPEAQAILQNAVDASGQEPLACLDQLIIQSKPVDNRSDSLDNEELLRMLRSIDERLLRLEDQRGFWSRFWEQFMNPPNRTGG
ncbi:MAG: hypothetical protein ABW101_16060 [Candidatus Thiodiazotropha sp.]